MPVRLWKKLANKVLKSDAPRSKFMPHASAKQAVKAAKIAELIAAKKAVQS